MCFPVAARTVADKIAYTHRAFRRLQYWHNSHPLGAAYRKEFARIEADLRAALRLRAGVHLPASAIDAAVRQDPTANKARTLWREWQRNEWRARRHELRLQWVGLRDLSVPLKEDLAFVAMDRAAAEKAAGMADMSWDTWIDPAQLIARTPKSEPPDPTEDFTSYSETDPNNRFSADANTLTVTALSSAENAWFNDDKGADHFAGDYEWTFATQITATVGANITCGMCMLTNSEETLNAIKTASGDYLGGLWYNNVAPYIRQRYIREVDNGGQTQDGTASALLSLSTWYYDELERDESVPDLEDRIFSDAARTTSVDTLNIGLGNANNFRYVAPAISQNSGASGTISYLVEDLDLQEGGGGGGIPILRRRRSA